MIYPLKMVIFHSFFASIPEGTRITPSHRWKHRRTPGNISGRATDSLDQNLRRECLRRTTRESLGWLGRLPLDLAMTKMVMVFISTKTENVTLLTTSKKLLWLECSIPHYNTFYTSMAIAAIDVGFHIEIIAVPSGSSSHDSPGFNGWRWPATWPASCRKWFMVRINMVNMLISMEKWVNMLIFLREFEGCNVRKPRCNHYHDWSIVYIYI